MSKQKEIVTDIFENFSVRMRLQRLFKTETNVERDLWGNSL